MEKPKQSGGNKPVARVQFGSIAASVFENSAQRTDGTSFCFLKTVLQKTFVDESGQFRNSSSFDMNDLPKAILALGKAYEFCLTANEAERQSGAGE